MSPTTRIILAALVVLALGGLIGVASWQARHPADAAAPGAVWQSSEDCRQCHAEVFGEWESSPHRRAWSDAPVQASFQTFGHDRKCESCHAPQPVFATGLDATPELRAQDHASGVNCLSCHLLTDGRGVAGGRTVADAPCRPVATPELQQSAMCGACHTAIFEDWDESRFKTEGRSCADCHMPAVAGRKGGRRHVCMASRDDALVRSAVEMSCRQEKGELIVAVSNRGAGHNFPGERHNRLLLLEMIARNAAGEVAFHRQDTIKGITPFRGESSAEKIRAGETIELRFPVVEPGTADVRLLYKRFPWQTDDEALVVHEEQVKLEK